MIRQGDLLHSDELRGFVRKRRLAALVIYGIFASIQAALAVWLVMDFRSETQLGVLLIEIVAFALLYRTVRHRSLASAFSPLREGEVVSELIEQTTVPEIAFAKCKGKQVELMRVTLGIRANEKTYLIELKQIDQRGLFQVGDRVIFSNALAAPIVTSRIPTKYACPFCGAIFSLAPETVACLCGNAVLQAAEDPSQAKEIQPDG